MQLIASYASALRQNQDHDCSQIEAQFHPTKLEDNGQVFQAMFTSRGGGTL